MLWRGLPCSRTNLWGKIHRTNIYYFGLVIIEATTGFPGFPFSFHQHVRRASVSVLEIYNFLCFYFNIVCTAAPSYRNVAFIPFFCIRSPFHSIAFAIVCRCVVLKNSTCYNTNEVYHLLLVSGCCCEVCSSHFVQVPIWCFNFLK